MANTASIDEPRKNTAHLEEAPVWNGVTEDPGKPATCTSQWPVQHKCGHIAPVTVWADPARRQHQMEQIQKHGLCIACAAGQRVK